MEIYIALETSREGYSPEQLGSTMTVKELIRELEQYDEEAKVIFSNDDGYTYGTINSYNIKEKEVYGEEE